MTLPGIVLAAGASSRIGRPKALLPVATGIADTFAARIADTFTRAGVHPVVIVTREALAAEVAAAARRARVVINPDPDRGQLSSLLTGVDALGACPAVVVTLVDVPFVAEETVRLLIARWEETRSPVVRPRYEGRHGHPTIFDARVIAALREADLQAGAKPVLERFAGEAISVDVTDPAVAFDVDTPQDHARAMELFADRGRQ